MLAGVVYLIYLLSACTLLHAAQSPLKRRMSEAALMAAKWMNVAKYFWARAKTVDGAPPSGRCVPSGCSNYTSLPSALSRWIQRSTVVD